MRIEVWKGIRLMARTAHPTAVILNAESGEVGWTG